MFEIELDHIAYDLSFLDQLRQEAEKIGTPKIRALVRGKIIRLKRILNDMTSVINIESDIEYYSDLNEEEKNALRGNIYNIAHCIENLIASQQNTEIGVISDIENFRGNYDKYKNQLIRMEEFEMGYLKALKKVLVNTYKILKKHKTEIPEEQAKIDSFKKKILEIRRDVKKVIHKCGKEADRVIEDVFVGAPL